MRRNWRTLMIMTALLALVATGCGSGDAGDAGDAGFGGGDAAGEDTAGGGEDGQSSGTIRIDGSSTVAPLTDAITEEYAEVNPDVTVELGVSGTGGGFERFCGEGSTEISNASRPIEEEEAAQCEENGFEFTEVRVGTDALTMVTNPSTDFVECLTTEELVTLWGPDAPTTWDQVNPEFPAEPITVFAPGADSGTFDFFNETILEPQDIEQPRQDYNASEDDNIIAQGVQGTPASWGYFGFAYFVNNPDGVNAVAYDAGDGCVEPSVETAQDDSYGLTRPLFIYVRNDALQEPHVADFVTYYLDTVGEVIEEVGYVPATQDVIDEARAAVEAEIG